MTLTLAMMANAVKAAADAEARNAATRALRATDVARVLGVPLELVQCHERGCTSPDTMHHHHRAVSRQRSPLACRCRHACP